MKSAIALKALSILAAFIIGCSKAPPPPPVATTLRGAAIGSPNEIPNLVKTGLPIDKVDADGNTALWVAVRHSKNESVRLLLAEGADPEIRGQQGWTSLHCNTFCNRSSDVLEITKLLIQHGADPNAVEPRYGDTPLHYAVRVARSKELVKLLIESNAKVDALNFSGSTPLQSAVANGNIEIVDILLTSGANPEIRNKSGFRPIDQLNACPNPKDIQAVFRKHGADDQRRQDLIKKWKLEQRE